MYLIPEDLPRKFKAVCSQNLSTNGRHIETLAYLFGYESEGNLIGTHLIFPEQDGTCSRVDDKGNLWNALFLSNNCIIMHCIICKQFVK